MAIISPNANTRAGPRRQEQQQKKLLENKKAKPQAEPRLTTTGQHLPFFVVFSVSCEPQSASVDPPVEPLLLQSLPSTIPSSLFSSSSSPSSYQLLFPGYSPLFIPRILVLLSLFTVTARVRVLSVVLIVVPPDNNFPPAQTPRLSVYSVRTTLFQPRPRNCVHLEKKEPIHVASDSGSRRLLRSYSGYTLLLFFSLSPPPP